MNFLALCQRLVSEAGISGSLTSVVSQTGENLRVVNWVNSAYEAIQNAQPSWKFMRHGFTVNTVINQDAYAYTACTDTTLASAIVNFGRWDTDSFKIYLTSVSDEIEVPFLDYMSWRSRYRVASQTAGRPTDATTLPDDKIGLGPKPNAVFVFSGDYYRSAKTMSVNTDDPIIPSQYHMVIVWRALMLYAAFEEAGSLYQTAMVEYNKINRMLELNQLPPIVMAGPLA